MYRTIILLTLLLTIVVSTSIANNPPADIVVKNAEGTIITSFTTLQYSYIEKITLSCSESDVTWTITPDLPQSLSLKSGVISGQVTELLDAVQFNITATNSAGSVSIIFPISVTTCPYGNFVFPRVDSTDQGMFIVKKDGEELFKAYLSNSGLISKYALCLPHEDEYDYSFNCQSAYYSSCNVILDDDDNMVYLSLKVAKGKTTEGKLRFIATEVPTPVAESDPYPVVSNEDYLLFISATSTRGNFTFTPSLPSTVVFDYMRSSIKGKWTERGIHQFTVECHNEKGVGSLVISVAVDRCTEGLYLAQMSRKQGQPDESFNITNSKNEVVFDYTFGTNRLKENLCLPEDDYTVHMYKSDPSGWNYKQPLLIMDETGYNLGIFTIEAAAREAHMGLSTIQSIHEGSTLRFTKKSVKSKWTQLKFKDSDWSEGTVGSWGSFDSSVVYFRKVFSLSSDRVYAHVLLDVLCKDKLTVFLNDEQVLQSSKLSEAGFTRFSLPSSAVTQGSNILAIMVERTVSQPSDPILLDVHLRPVSAPCLSYTLSGEASDDLPSDSPSNPPSNAFDDDPLTFWISDKLPSTLFYTFHDNRHEMINQVTFYKVSGLATIPRSFAIYGIRGDEKVLLKEIHDSLNLLGTGYATIRFSNKQAFNQYAFVFTKTDSTSVQVNEIGLYSCNELYCKKKIGYASIEAGSAHLKSCPFGSVGTRQMKCVDVDNQPEWEDDRSACLQRTPSKGIAYVDSTFLLYNVSMSSWETSVEKGIKDIITTNLVVKSNETEFTFVRDMTDDVLPQIRFSLRFTLEEDIGDYVRRHTTYLINDFNNLLAKKFGTIHRGISIECLDGPHLYESIHWSKIITNTITVSIIVILSLILYLRTCKRTTSRKTLTMYKRNKLDGKTALLSENNYIVCCNNRVNSRNMTSKTHKSCP